MRLVCLCWIIPILLLCACEEGEEEIEQVAESRSTAELAGERIRFKEMKYATLESVIPGFGGYYLEGQDVVARLVHMPEQQHAVEILTQRLRHLLDRAHVDRRSGALVERHLVFQKANYSFLELNRWRNRLLETRLDGLVLIGIQLRNNVVRLGVRDDSDREQAYLIAEQLLIPQDALNVVVTDVELSSHTVRSQFGGQVPPGVEIQIDQGVLGDTCTLGFGADTQTSTGFFVNTHCTGDWAVDGNDQVSQLDVASGNYLGEEAEDPASYSCTFGGTTHNCRFSDAARFEHDASSEATVDFGTIARTEDWLGSLDIDHVDPIFAIVDEGVEEIGLQVDKVGRTTGWTYGEITETCTDLLTPGGVLECQSVATYDSDVGDSGAPVFYFNFSSDVELVGLNWGKNSSGTEAYYSGMVNIHAEFSSFTTF